MWGDLMKKRYLLLFLLLLNPLLTFALEDEKVYLKNEYDTVTLSKCVDGNSARFLLGDNEIKVKFLAIDTSNLTLEVARDDETAGSYVFDYVCSLFENANDIKIEYEPNSEKEDKYGRILAWVYVDDTLLQEHLLRLGYAKVSYMYDDYTYNDILLESENYAKVNKLGIWEKEEEEETVEVSDEPSQDNEKNNSIISIIFDFLSDVFEQFMNFIDRLMRQFLK